MCDIFFNSTDIEVNFVKLLTALLLSIRIKNKKIRITISSYCVMKNFNNTLC